MSLDHDAIRKAYPDAVVIDDSKGAFNDKGNNIILDNTKVNAARAQIDADLKAIEYKAKRKVAYPSIADQLDMQYWDKKNGTTTWVDAVTKVKTDNPKP